MVSKGPHFLVRVMLHRHFFQTVSAWATYHPHTTIITAKCIHGKMKTQAAQTGKSLYVNSQSPSFFRLKSLAFQGAWFCLRHACCGQNPAMNCVVTSLTQTTQTDNPQPLLTTDVFCWAHAWAFRNWAAWTTFLSGVFYRKEIPAGKSGGAIFLLVSGSIRWR